MNAKVLIAGVAVAVMVAGASSAQTSSSKKYASPSQPVPYSQMDSYMSATPKQRAAMSAGGMGADTSATAGSNIGSAGADTSSAVNPAGPAMAPGATPPDAMSPGGAANGSMSARPSATPPMTGDTPANPGAATPPK